MLQFVQWVGAGVLAFFISMLCCACEARNKLIFHVVYVSCDQLLLRVAMINLHLVMLNVSNRSKEEHLAPWCRP